MLGAFHVVVGGSFSARRFELVSRGVEGSEPEPLVSSLEPRRGPLDLFIRLGGGEPAVSRTVRRASAWFIALAIVMTFTAAVAGISMFFALTTALQAEFTVAIVLAVLWGLLILSLDRFMVLSMEGLRSLGHLLLAALPRVFLALCIGAVVSFPITLQIFDKEISEELVRIQKERFEEIDKEMARSDEKRRLDEARKAYDGNEKSINGDFAASPSSEVKKAKARVDDLTAKEAKQQEEVDLAAQLEICEREGRQPGVTYPPEVERKCSTRPGKGPPYPEYYADLKVKQKVLSKTREELQAATTAYSGAQAADAKAAAADKSRRIREAVNRRDDLKSELDEAQKKYDEKDARLRESNLNNTGLLARSIALDRTVNNQNYGGELRAKERFVVGMFIAIELMPVLVKMMSFRRGGSRYERRLEEIQKTEESILEKHLSTTLRVERDREDRRCANEDDRGKREEDLDAYANERMFKAARDLADQAIDSWVAASHHQLREFYREIPGAASTPRGSSTSRPEMAGSGSPRTARDGRDYDDG